MTEFTLSLWVELYIPNYADFSTINSITPEINYHYPQFPCEVNTCKSSTVSMCLFSSWGYFIRNPTKTVSILQSMLFLGCFINHLKSSLLEYFFNWILSSPTHDLLSPSLGMGYQEFLFPKITLASCTFKFENHCSREPLALYNELKKYMTFSYRVLWVLGTLSLFKLCNGQKVIIQAARYDHLIHYMNHIKH